MPKIQAETANGLVETEPPEGKKLVLASKMPASIFCTAAAATRAAPPAASKFSKAIPAKWVNSNETVSQLKRSWRPMFVSRARFASIAI
jgi:hypothetical protein